MLRALCHQPCSSRQANAAQPAGNQIGRIGLTDNGWTRGGHKGGQTGHIARFGAQGNLLFTPATRGAHFGTKLGSRQGWGNGCSGQVNTDTAQFRVFLGNHPPHAPERGLTKAVNRRPRRDRLRILGNQPEAGRCQVSF